MERMLSDIGRGVWLGLCIAVALIAGIVVLAGCGPGAQNQGSPAAASQQANTTCTFGAVGADVQVQIAGDSEPCSAQEAVLATDGQSWYSLDAIIPVGSPGTADGETMAQTCSLSKGSSTFTVEDAGTMSYGTTICSAEEQGGWVNTP